MHLSAIQSPQGFFTLLELDNPTLFATQLGLDITVPQNLLLWHKMQNSLLQAAAGQISGIAVDAELTLPLFLERYSVLQQPPLQSPPPGLIIRLDLPQVDATQTMPVFSQTWGVEHIANNYALALLELQYDPRATDALQKKQLVAELHDFCQQQHIDFMLKLLIHHNGEMASAAQLQELQLQAVQELSPATEIIALESPQDPLAVATLTAELDVPWVVIGNQPEVNQFQDHLRMAMDNGAKGFLAGAVLWSEMTNIRRPDQGIDEVAVEQFIHQDFGRRLEQISQLVNETVVI